MHLTSGKYLELSEHARANGEPDGHVTGSNFYFVGIAANPRLDGGILGSGPRTALTLGIILPLALIAAGLFLAAGGGSANNGTFQPATDALPERKSSGIAGSARLKLGILFLVALLLAALGYWLLAPDSAVAHRQAAVVRFVDRLTPAEKARLELGIDTVAELADAYNVDLDQLAASDTTVQRDRRANQAAEAQAETAAKMEISRLAKLNNMPDGVLGVRLLENPAGLLSLRPKVRRRDSQNWTEVATWERQEVRITYWFGESGRNLMMITLTFAAPGTDALFERNQMLLNRRYGPLTVPTTSSEFKSIFEREAGPVGLFHSLTEGPTGRVVEQVVIYKRQR